MTATIKSRVLTREEKGIGGISMKRLIFCGMGGGIIYLVLNLSPLSMCSLPMLLFVFITLLIASGQRYGIPRYLWIQLTIKGRMLLTQNPNGLIESVRQQLNLTATQSTVHSHEIFVGAHSTTTDLSGIQILNHDRDDAVGFEILSDDNIHVEVL